jgi:hypothetical protein
MPSDDLPEWALQKAAALLRNVEHGIDEAELPRRIARALVEARAEEREDPMDERTRR